MRNFFNFFPVGQGLFYCGLLHQGDFCFVYDCGTESEPVDLLPFIKELSIWKTDRVIDFLVISHFHEDHINNIENLKNAGFKIKKFFLPYISEFPKVSIFILAMYFFGDFNEISNERDLKTFNFFANFYRERVSNQELEDIHFFNESDNESFVCHDGNYSYLYRTHLDWIFKFFNKTDVKISKKAKKLLEEIDDLEKNEGKDIEAILSEKGGLAKLKQIYKKIFKNDKLNDTSLILLHYPNIFSFKYDWSYNIRLLFNNKNINSVYTLLTGDIPFDKTLANDVIKSYPTGTSGVVQVPHHGAKNEWTEFSKYFLKFDTYVVPYGIENHYGHPSPFVKSSIPKGSLYEVTQFNGFSYSIEIW